MPLAYWCVLIAAILPIAIAVVAKAGVKGDNRNPRAHVAELPPLQRRAYAAHLNAYENLPFFAAAVIIAVTSSAPLSIVNTLAAIYIALRIAHAAFYVGDIPQARSTIFLAAWLVNVAIFVSPLFK